MMYCKSYRATSHATLAAGVTEPTSDSRTVSM